MVKELKWCERCNEKSVIIRLSKGGKRTEICLNKGHGFIRELPVVKLLEK
jgi:hypothetical protein